MKNLMNMKKIILAIMATVTINLGIHAQAPSKDTLTSKDGIQTLQIKTSAVCDMCKETLEKVMAYEKGVKESNLDVDSKVLTVKYDARKTSPDKIRKAVILAGYDADELTADPKAYDNLNACCKKDVKH